MIFEIFHLSGNKPVDKHRLKTWVEISAKKTALVLKNQNGMLSGHVAHFFMDFSA